LKRTRNWFEPVSWPRQPASIHGVSPWGGHTNTQGDQKIRKKLPNFSKNSPKSDLVKKGQNIYNKAQFESPKHLHQATFKTLEYLQQTMF
jgi:hypothetical protein